MKSRNTPGVSSDMRNLVLGSLEIVFHELLYKWDGPFNVIDIRGDIVTLSLPSLAGWSQFRSNVVKPYIPDQPLPITSSVELDEQLLHPNPEDSSEPHATGPAITHPPPNHDG